MLLLTAPGGLEDVVEPVDTSDLKSDDASHAGSIPAVLTIPGALLGTVGTQLPRSSSPQVLIDLFECRVIADTSVQACDRFGEICDPIDP